MNSSATRHPSLLFTVIDNLQVTDTPVVPEPGTAFFAACAAGFSLLGRRRSRRR